MADTDDMVVTTSGETQEETQMSLQLDQDTPETPEDGAGEPEKAPAEPQADGDAGEPEPKHTAKEIHDNPKLRIKRATAEAAEAKREAAEYRQRVEAQEAELEDLRRRATPSQAPPKDEKGPSEDQFETYAEYVDARAEWIAERKFASKQREISERHRQAQIRQAAEGRVTAFQQQVEAEGEGFIDNLAPEVLKVDPDSLLGHSITSSPMATKVMKYLSDNPERFRALSSLHPALVIREIGRIEGELRGVGVTANAPRAVSVSRAKPPVRPVAGQPNVGDELSDDSSFEDFVKHENAKERARLH